MKKTVRYAVDRREGSLLVLIPDDGTQKELLLDKNQYDFSVGDVLDVTFEDETVLDVCLQKEEAQARERSNRARLSALFAKGRKPKN